MSSLSSLFLLQQAEDLRSSCVQEDRVGTEDSLEQCFQEVGLEETVKIN